MNADLPNTNLLAFFFFLIGKRKRLKVVGKSMFPLLQPGEEILIDPQAYRDRPPQINEIVVVAHPLYQDLIIVKRIGKIIDDKYYLIGDNPIASTDSRHWGKIEKTSILAKVTNRFS